MTRRGLKKACKRAMEILISQHGYRRDEFARAGGEESIDTPAGMRVRGRRVTAAFLDPGPLPGTWLWWETPISKGWGQPFPKG